MIDFTAKDLDSFIAQMDVRGNLIDPYQALVNIT